MYFWPKNNVLNHKQILITGAGDGIGREAAITYARYGAYVTLLGKTEYKLNNVKQTISSNYGYEPLVIPLDLACNEPTLYQHLAQVLSQKVYYLDGLLNNAGILGEISPMIQQHPLSWMKVISVNINGTFMLTQALLPLLLKSKSPSLIFTTSTVGRQGRANWGAYSVSKFATEGMMQVLAKEYPATTLRVNCINPGSTRTNMRAIAFPGENADLLKTPRDIMPIYIYLMSDDSQFETGISFNAQDYT